MKPNEKGWLGNYLEFRKDLLRDIATSSRKSSHPEHSLYRVLQPTGLMYGHSVGHINLPDVEEWDARDKMKILLAESLVSSSILLNEKPVSNPEEISALISKAVENIGNFYNNIFPEMATPAKTLFGKKRSPLEMAERILEKRIELTSGLENNFWAYFFHNSLLFLDIFIFSQWIHTNADKIVADFFRYERDELRFSVVKVIAAASHASMEVVAEEKKLLEYFINSTNLSSEKRKEAFVIFENGINLNEINLSSNNSWILKKFFLEIAILTLWADKKVEQPELDFLNDFSVHLNFSEDDLENSMIAVEGFVLDHWEQLDRLQNRQDFQQVSEKFIQRIANIAHKNKGRLLKELQSRQDIMALLQKAKASELSADEKVHLQSQLIVVLKSIPTFVIISLPQKFLTLSTLLRVLPDDLFKD